jgi:hypothetical protein
MGENGLISAEEKRLLQRKAWTAANYRTVGTKLTVQDHERLLTYCKRLGLSRYALLQSLLLECLAEDDRREC